MSDASKRLTLGHLHVDRVTFGDALREIEAMVERGQGGTVLTPNVDHVVLASHDDRFRRAYEAADLSLADGMPVVWASHALREPVPEKISGSDLVPPLLDLADAHAWRVYLLGGGEGVAERASARVAAAHVHLTVVGAEGPRIDMNEPAAAREDVVAKIRHASPDLVLVGLGAPKQELWIHEAAPSLRPAVMLGVGASIDFLAGTAQRAPAWVSHAGLEWFYRLTHEPRRLWRRYLQRDPEFVLIVLQELLHHSRMPPPQGE